MHHDQRAAVSLKDKNENRTYRLENDLGHDIVTYRVDGGICKSNDIKKCDFAIYTVDNHLILIELKGSDYLQAVRQLISSYNELIKPKKIPLTRLHARIVLSKARIPDIKTSEDMKLERILKLHNGTFKKKSQLLKDKTSEL